MKKNSIFIALTLGCSIFTSAQVGVNTKSPETTLDVRGKNDTGTTTAIPGDVATTDGVLVPRVSSLNTNGSVNGQLVYLIANAGTHNKGFYYWDGTAWVAISANGASTGDTTNDAWINDAANTLVKLGTNSDGSTARTAGTEFIAKDNGQVGIGTAAPNSSAILEINSTNKGVLLPRVALTSATDQTTIASPATGLLAYNKGTAGLSYNGYVFWNGTEWRTLNNSSTTTGTIDNITCTSVSLSPATYTAGTAYNGTLSVPYTGGNGGIYPATTITSTNVTGLTAKLISGNFANGSGTLQYSVTGTPSASSPTAANFALTIGGKTCNATVGDDNAGGITTTATSIGPLYLNPGEVLGGAGVYHRYVTSPDGKYSVRVKIEAGYSFAAADINIRTNIASPLPTIMWNFMTDWIDNGHYVKGNNATPFPVTGVWLGNDGGNGATFSNGHGMAWADPDVYFGSPEYRRYTWTSTDPSDKTMYIFTFMLGAPNSGLIANPTNCPNGVCSSTKAYLKIEQTYAP